MWFDSPTEFMDTKPVAVAVTQPQLPIEELRQNAEVATLDQKPQLLTESTAKISDWTSAALIADIYAMDDSSFVDFLNALGNRKIPLSRSLIEGLLGDLFTLSDSLTRHRIIELLGASRFANYNKKGMDEFGIENWVLSKIRDGEQPGEWLDVLSYWGVLDDTNATYLAVTLESNYDTSQRVSTLLALSRKIGIGEFSNDKAKSEITALIRPYLDSNDDLERAAAIRTLKAYPGEDYVDRLTTALGDRSEKIRISATRVMIEGQRITSEEVKDALMQSMQSSSTSALERLTSYTALQRMPLGGKHYEAVYDFRINSADRLSKKHRREFGNKPTPWQ